MKNKLNRRTILQLGIGGACLNLAPNHLLGAKQFQIKNRKEHIELALNIEMWLRHLPFEKRIGAAKELGFNFIEFWPWRNKNINAIKDECEKHEIKVTQFTAWGFSPGLNNPKNHKRFIKEIEESCAIAKKIGAQMMTVVAGNDQPGMSKQEMEKSVIDGLTLVKDIAQEFQVMLILEPMNIRRDHKGHFLYGSKQAIRICESINSPWIKINWDLYHMQISEGDLCGHLKEGIKQIGYIQLADHPGRNEPGTGEIHYPRVIKELKKLGYNKPIGVECYPSLSDQESAYNMRANLGII
jgi:hydroxypyruvate isomerase